MINPANVSGRGWVVPLAAPLSPQIAFVVTVSGSGLRTDRTQLWSDRTYLTHAGVRHDLIDPIGVNLSRMMIGAGLFGDTKNDPVANLKKVHQPFLAIFGDQDRSIPPGESLSIYERALQAGGNAHYTLRVIHDADHNMRYSTTGYGRSRPNAAFAPGYIELVTSWINGLIAGPPVTGADAPPAQPQTSRPIRPLSWYESGGLQLTLILVMLLASLTHPIAAAVRRLSGRRSKAPYRWPLRQLATAGSITVLGTVTYLFSIVATGATSVDSTVLGRPPAWLALQLVTIAALIGLVAAVARWVPVRRQLTRFDQAQFVPVLVGGLIFLPWAAYWGLFTF